MRNGFHTGGARRATAAVAAAAAITMIMGLGTTSATAATSWTDSNRNGQIDRRDRGEAVRCVQRAVLFDGRSVGPNRDDGDFGGGTEAGVISYQRAHTDTSGRPLSADGQVGPNTGGAMTHEVYQLRHEAWQHGDTGDEFTAWINDCVDEYFTNSGQSIFH